ncbi:MAG TPA: hypothetical protein VLY83_06480 [Methanoregula sp.]|nr:hypothetical protein [Methanoregula sp.]
MPKKEERIRTKKVCRTDSEFEELFLPGTHEKKKIQETVREPEKLKESILKRLKKTNRG